MSLPLIQLVTRSTCGSCFRVLAQITPIVQSYGGEVEVVQVDAPGVSGEWEMEFGDRVPVLLIDEEEFACWEVDNEELVAELERWA